MYTLKAGHWPYRPGPSPEQIRDRRNHNELVQAMALYLMQVNSSPLSMELRRRLPRIQAAWKQHQFLSNVPGARDQSRAARQSARDRSRYLRGVFHCASVIERAALEHALSSARQP